MKAPKINAAELGMIERIEIMNEKLKNILCQIINAVIIAGVILFLIGAYYCVIKAGIPYQDPPLELQIQYAVNMGIGEILTKGGFLTALCAGMIRLLLGLVWKKIQSK